MGVGGVAAPLDAGYGVAPGETTQSSLDQGVNAIRKTYDSLVQRGRLVAAVAEARIGPLKPTLALDAVAGADLDIECVFEDLGVKPGLFLGLGPLLGPRAVLATNTSAGTWTRSQRRVGGPRTSSGCISSVRPTS